MALIKSPEPLAITPTIIPRAEHCISRANISDHALKVLYRLKDAGFAAYLVGGGVRDLILGSEPKDFDIATDAYPEQVKELFRNCRLIGRRFRLAHIHFGRHIIEVATFRAALDGDGDEGNGARVTNGRIVRDNAYGTIEQDAQRRDFSINALYYNIRDFSVVDYADAFKDLRAGTLRLLGDPEIRYREDPVRMLRAARFAAKLGFELAPETAAPIRKLAPLLADIAPARLFDEVIKLFHSGHAAQTFTLLSAYGLLAQLFPDTADALDREPGPLPETFILKALENTDNRINAGQPVTPAFLYAVLLWEPLRVRAAEYRARSLSDLEALQEASRELTGAQMHATALPKRFSTPMREIWMMQPRFERQAGKRALRMLGHPRFRAAYDFFCLRAAAGEELADACEWWTRLQAVDAEEQRRMTKTQGPRRSRKRKSAAASTNAGIG